MLTPHFVLAPSELAFCTLLCIVGCITGGDRGMLAHSPRMDSPLSPLPPTLTHLLGPAARPRLPKARLIFGAAAPQLSWGGLRRSHHASRLLSRLPAGRTYLPQTQRASSPNLLLLSSTEGATRCKRTALFHDRVVRQRQTRLKGGDRRTARELARVCDTGRVHAGGRQTGRERKSKVRGAEEEGQRSLELRASGDDFGRALVGVALERLVEHALCVHTVSAGAYRARWEERSETNSELLDLGLVARLVAPRDFRVEELPACASLRVSLFAVLLDGGKETESRRRTRGCPRRRSGLRA